MTEDQADKLYRLAECIHAIARQLRPPVTLEPSPCSPVEINVVHHVLHNPGTSARAAAAGTRLPSSNFSRVTKDLVAKGLLRREDDAKDGRGIRLFPTELAMTNRVRMRNAWSTALEGTIDDPALLDGVIAALETIETQLASRSEKSRQRTNAPVEPVS